MSGTYPSLDSESRSTEVALLKWFAHVDVLLTAQAQCRGTIQYVYTVQQVNMRSSRVVRASDSQCRSRNCPGFDPSILRHSGIWGAADEAVLNIVYRISLSSHWVHRPPFLAIVVHSLLSLTFSSPEGVCTDEFLSRKPGFLLSAMHSHTFRWFSAAPLVF